MSIRPGSFLWLLCNDVRLNWRRFADMLGRRSTGRLVAVLGVGAVVLHALAWPAVGWLSPQIHGEGAPSLLLSGALVSVASWMVAHSLFGAGRTLYDRGDLDLLLGSPVPALRVFAAKATAVAAGTFGSVGFLLLPVANVGVLADRPAWLGVWAVLGGLSLIATALGLALTIGLFFAVGPARARIVTQMTGAAIGGAFVLALQVAAVLPASAREALAAASNSAASGLGKPIAAVLLLPVAAARGELAAMLALLASGGVALAVAVTLLAGKFAQATLAASGMPSQARRSRTADRPFRGGVDASLRRKEWRLLVRDPNLFAQVGLQIVYTVPIAVVLLRSEAVPVAMALAPTIVVVAAQVAASLAWLTVSGEDAPELIASAPVAPTAVDRAKLGAVALPVLAIMALPLLGLWLVSWRAAVTTFAFSILAAASTALLNFWHPMPGNRRGMLRRHAQSKLVGLVEHLLAILWAVAIVLVFLGKWLAVLPALVAAMILSLAWRHHARTEALVAVDRRTGPPAKGAPHPLSLSK